MKRNDVLFLVSILFLFNCAAQEYSTQHTELSIDQSDVPLEKKVENNNPDRKIILDATIEIKTTFPDSIHDSIINIAKKYSGYVLKSTHNSTTIRVPFKNFYDVMNGVETIGTIVNKNIYGQDVTEKYFDLEIRLDSAEKIRERYLILLDRANSIDSSLKIEKEIERLNKEIDAIKGQMKRLAHLSSYSSITVNTIKEVKPGPIGYVFKGLYEAIKWLFVRE
jgi:hypothetical protein